MVLCLHEYMKTAILQRKGPSIFGVIHEFKFYFYHLLPVWLCTHYITSLSLGFRISWVSAHTAFSQTLSTTYLMSSLHSHHHFPLLLSHSEIVLFIYLCSWILDNLKSKTVNRVTVGNTIISQVSKFFLYRAREQILWALRAIWSLLWLLNFDITAWKRPRTVHKWMSEARFQQNLT